MKLVIGLGNMGPHYVGTRHNVGFRVVEYLAEHYGLEWHKKDSFKATIAEGDMQGQKLILAKPLTYYNLSGEAAQAIQAFYKLDLSDILVIHDELDLPFGVVRARIGGSSAGNNGIKSLSDHLGSDFARIRIGIANDHLADADAADYVLSAFNHHENIHVGHVTKAAAELAELFIDDNKKFEHTSVRIDDQRIE